MEFHNEFWALSRTPAVDSMDFELWKWVALCINFLDFSGDFFKDQLRTKFYDIFSSKSLNKLQEGQVLTISYDETPRMAFHMIYPALLIDLVGLHCLVKCIKSSRFTTRKIGQNQNL